MNSIESKPRGYYLNERKFDQRKPTASLLGSSPGIFSRGTIGPIAGGNWSNVAASKNILVIYSFGTSPSKKQLLEDKFNTLAAKWYDEIADDPSSSLTRITSGNENYLKIIALGHQVIPLILRELQSNCAPWFLALQILTGNSNVGRDRAGNFGDIADAWLEWGRVNGYLAR